MNALLSHQIMVSVLKFLTRAFLNPLYDPNQDGVKWKTAVEACIWGVSNRGKSDLMIDDYMGVNHTLTALSPNQSYHCFYIA